MIGLEDVYTVVVAVVPLYVPLGLGYASVKFWHMFKPDQCDAINRFNCFFIMPFFTFQFTAGVDPYNMNFRFLVGDMVAKAIVGVVLVAWANVWKKGELSWAITSFSLSSFNNTLVVGVPLLKAMYGVVGEDLVVQSSVNQSLLWFPILLFLLEFRRTYWINRPNVRDEETNASNVTIDSVDQNSTEAIENGTPSSNLPMSPNSAMIIKKVCAKLATNPNLYACALGLIWALLANRWNLKMPTIVGGSIFIMAKAGSGVAMFTMGLFMALQDRVMACGVRLTLYGMVWRFVGGPLTTMVGSVAMGLRSNLLHIAIIQAALPQAIASFVFAQEYGLHANVLSTSVIFGTIVSLPLLIGYYIILDQLH